jgi:hypothetical protein
MCQPYGNPAFSGHLQNPDWVVDEKDRTQGSFTLSSHWKDTVREIASIGEGTSFIIDREQFAALRDTIMLSIILNNFKRSGDLANMTRAKYRSGHWVLVGEQKF